MSTDPARSFPTAEPARQARELLVVVLAALQRHDSTLSQLAEAVRHTASASSALYEAENTAGTAQAASAGIRIAIEQLGAALTALHDLESQSGTLHPATEAVARTLALLYPIAQASLRQRRDVVMDSERSPEATSHTQLLAQVPRAPEPYGRPRRDTPPFQGEDNRKHGDRIFIEADIGLLSESHFYTGLSQDLSLGGLFVATYQVKAPGTKVALFFVLPDGRSVSVHGNVRWTRGASADLPPGMGIAFEQLPTADMEAIARFCRDRSPIYFDSDDG